MKLRMVVECNCAKVIDWNCNFAGYGGTNVATPVFGSFSSSATHTGWTIGAGIEAALGGRWTEYLYVDLGTVSGGPFVTPIVAPSGALLIGSFSSHVTDNILRVGVNYRF
jgi:outer membrane immunogenic protein